MDFLFVVAKYVFLMTCASGGNRKICGNMTGAKINQTT